MPHTITYNSVVHILEANIQGDYLAAEAKQLMLETLKMIEEHNCFRILIDVRDAEIRLSNQEIYTASLNFSEAARASDLPILKSKRAIVVIEESKDTKYVETLFVTRGHGVKLFQDVDEAKEWLLK
jgi:hypothetical protein